jgi:uncharacterized protein (DUF1697 family)
MPVHLAFLRAINLGGPTQVSMAELRTRLAATGYEDVRSILQSGNLVFRSTEADPRRIERRLNEEIAPQLAARTEFFVRSEPEWRTVVAQNPFPKAAVEDPGHLMVAVLRDAPPDSAWRALAGSIPGREQVRGIGRYAYLVYPDGAGRSKVTATFIEKHLATRGTSRNWNTVRKVAALAAA